MSNMTRSVDGAYTARRQALLLLETRGVLCQNQTTGCQVPVSVNHWTLKFIVVIIDTRKNEWAVHDDNVVAPSWLLVCGRVSVG